MDRVHRRLFAGGAAHEANNCEQSGNHRKNVTSARFSSRGCSSPVDRRRKYTPVLSEYTRYLPSGLELYLLAPLAQFPGVEIDLERTEADNSG